MNYLVRFQETKTILIVDDIPKNLQILLENLKNAGYELLIAQSGKRAIETAQSIYLDLILLNIKMNQLDGFETCRHLKNNPNTNNIPIIFISAFGDTNNIIQGLQLGAVDVLVKPIDAEELLARIQTHLYLHDLQQRLTKEIHKQKLLFSIRDRLRQSFNLKSILETATQEIRAFLNCDVVGITKLNNQIISIKAYCAVEGIEVNSESIIPHNCFCFNPDKYELYLQGKTQVIEKHETEIFLTNTIGLEKPQTRLIAPILIKNTDISTNYVTQNPSKDENTLWGWLIADQYQSHRQWQSDQIELLIQLTTQLAIAIKQALLHERLFQLATKDSLTTAYNRRYFDQQLDLEWRRHRRNRSPISLILFDVDFFKLYNDNYGHQQGDLCLKQVSQAIFSTLKRPGDLLARYGGEEFVAILPNTPQAGAVKVAEAIRLAVKKLAISHQASSVDSFVTISIGIASTIPKLKEQPERLIKAADLALYQAKERGRDCVVVYSTAILKLEKLDLETSWVKRLRQALIKDLFSLYAQPIVALQSNNCQQYFEILLRLNDDSDRLIAVDVFLDIANNNNLMPQIDVWVINNLFDLLNSKAEPNYWQNYRFSINLSGASLNQEFFLEFLSEKIINSHLPAKLFCFEITESIAISQLTQVAKFIKSLKNLGCQFALDNFGAGICSLTYLKSLPIDYLKIDGSLIRELNQDNSCKVMVEAINHIAEGMGLKTVAELVENRQVLDLVKNLNIDYAQGFHLAYPDKLTNLINDKHKNSA